MQIKNQQNFYAGVMFVLFGVAAMVVAKYTLDLGSAADMGPGFFPFYLGGLLAILGTVVSITGLSRTALPEAKVLANAMPFWIFLAIVGFSVIGVWLGLSARAGVAAGVVAGCLLAMVTGMRTMGLILGAVALFGMLVKGVGLVLSVALLLMIAGFASHETRFREVALSIVFLAILAVGVFLYGLKLQIPIWPDLPELTNIFTPAKKR